MEKGREGERSEKEGSGKRRGEGSAPSLIGCQRLKPAGNAWHWLPASHLPPPSCSWPWEAAARNCSPSLTGTSACPRSFLCCAACLAGLLWTWHSALLRAGGCRPSSMAGQEPAWDSAPLSPLGFAEPQAGAQCSPSPCLTDSSFNLL